jgi:hypothetical protein
MAARKYTKREKKEIVKKIALTGLVLAQEGNKSPNNMRKIV